MSNRTENDRFLTEPEYRTAVAEFDRLWGSNTSPEDQVNMERLIRLIDAFEIKGDEAMKIEPQKEHQWLQKLVGKWTCEGEATMEPGKPPASWKATESVRSLGGLWFPAEGQGEMPGGGSSTTLMTFGYDPQKKRYVGTFIASMMTHLWVYDGVLDAAGRVLTLDTEGPDFSAEGKMAKYEDVIEFKSDDYRVLTSHMLGDDGVRHVIMTAHYRRTK
jgi:hypothetical protein